MEYRWKYATAYCNWILITFPTLIDGNIFWNMVAINRNSIPSPLKLFRTTSGWYKNCFGSMCGSFNTAITSRLKEYEDILNVIVGPLGSLTNFMYMPDFVWVNATRCDTLNMPAALTKSLITLFCRTYNSISQKLTLS